MKWDVGKALTSWESSHYYCHCFHHYSSTCPFCNWVTIQDQVPDSKPRPLSMTLVISEQAPLWTSPQTELCWWRREFSQALTLTQSLSFYDTHSFIVPRTINAAPPQAATEKYLRGPQSRHTSVPPNYSATISIQTALLRSVFVKTEAPIK